MKTLPISTYLNNFIARELEEWNVCSVAGHEVTVQDPQDTFVCDDEQISLFSLEFENNRFQANSQIVIRLFESAFKIN